MTSTVDPGVVILSQGDGHVIYWCPADGRVWKVLGTCNCCGACEVGSINPNLIWTGIPVGQPGACVDRRGMARPDCPITPEGVAKMQPLGCVLRARYLHGD